MANGSDRTPTPASAALPRPPRRTLTTRQRLGLWCAHVLSWGARVFPLRVGYALSDRVGDFLYWRSTSYRQNVIENLRHVYSGQVSESYLRRKARMVFRTSSRNFWDLARVPALTTENIDRIVTYAGHDLSLLDEARAAGKGGIIITGHIGAFDFSGQLFYMKKYSPYTLTAPTVGEFVYSVVNELRLSQGAALEDISPGAIRRMLKTLNSGGFVGLVADRDFTNAGSPVRFFDADASMPTGPVRMARQTGAPIIPFIVQRNDGGQHQRYTMHIREPFFVPRTTDEAADIQQGLEQMIAFLEWGISLAPEQWVMFQRVWTEDGARRRRWGVGQRSGLVQRVVGSNSVAEAPADHATSASGDGSGSSASSDAPDALDVEHHSAAPVPQHAEAAGVDTGSNADSLSGVTR